MGGTGKGHFLEGHGFEGCCFIKLGRFHVVKEPVESEGRKREQSAGWGCRPYVDEGGVGGYPLLAGCEKEGKTSEEESFLGLGWAFLRSGGRWPCCQLSRQAEHEFGAHRSRHLQLRKVQLPETHPGPHSPDIYLGRSSWNLGMLNFITCGVGCTTGT